MLMWLKDRENESRFGATPVPGKIGMAMAGQGLHAAPPPRPPHHNYFAAGSNPGNQLYVGNVSDQLANGERTLTIVSCSCLTNLAGRTSRTCSGRLARSNGRTSRWVRMGAREGLER